MMVLLSGILFARFVVEPSIAVALRYEAQLESWPRVSAR
jgi:hypothetical protein